MRRAFFELLPSPAAWRRGAATAAACGLLLAASAAAAAAAPRRLAVSQVRQLEADETRLRAFLEIVDDRGERVKELAPEALDATLGAEPLELKSLAPMEGSGEGVAYVFLVDVSRSLSAAEFDRIRAELRAWIEGLAPADRAALVAFGDASRLLVDFTADAGELLAALAELGPTDDRTLLHRALVEALQLCRRRDPGLPARRAIVVLTDGRDEGSGLEFDDVLAELRSEPAPVYAVGHSQIRDDAERRRHLELLHRIASVSGGAFLDSGGDAFAPAYAAIRRAVRRVWVADFTCAACLRDGREYRFQVTLAAAGRLLTDGAPMRLLPPRPGAPPAAAPSLRAAAGEAPRGAPPAGSTPAATEPPDRGPGSALGPEPDPAGTGDARPAPDAAPSAPREARPVWPWLLALLALAALVAFAARRRLAPHPPASGPGGEPAPSVAGRPAPSPAGAGGRSAPPDAAGPAGKDPRLPPPLPPAAGSGPSRAVPRPRAQPRGRDLPLRSLRLLVVRGSRPGRQYRIAFQEQAKVGARSTCDCVLAEEPGVEAEQFELYQQGGRIFIRNLAQKHPTLLEGLPIPPRQALESEQLVGTGELILRVILD